MNKELGAFLNIVDDLICEMSFEIMAIKSMSEEDIYAFGKKDHKRLLKAKEEGMRAISSLALISAVKINNGKPLLDVLANLMVRGDNKGDLVTKQITQYYCDEIVERYISLEGTVE